MNLAGVIVFSIASASDTRSALQAVYEALGGAGWSDNTNWTSSADPCYWAHVSCSDASEVESLDMSASAVTGLNGTLPDELGAIPTLKTLALFADSNQAHRISGTLPAALSKLSAIYLYLQSATWPNMPTRGSRARCHQSLASLGTSQISTSVAAGDSNTT